MWTSESSEAPILKGYLSKEGKSLVRKWQQRYFVLFQDRIDYWSEEKEFAGKRKKKGSIDLSGCSLATAEQHTKRMNTFGIFHTHRRDYFLEAPNQATLLLWVEQIENILGVNEKGVSIEDFELLTVVGQGSYGKVIQVKKRDTGKIYAMKVIHKNTLKRAEEKSQSSFNRELTERKHLAGLINVEKAAYKHWLVQATKAERRVLEVVNHPFIVKLHFALRTPSELCLVMDFINGGELFLHIAKSKRFSEERAKFYTAELILALEYLHEMDIIYRDLKPENVLLDSVGHVRLTDFGHSKDEHSRNDRAFSIVGSPYYMAPEILLHKGHGKEADWWSLGVLAYEMMAGLPPFYSENTKEAYQRLLTCPIQYPDYFSPAAVAFLGDLLQVDPSQRMGGADPPGHWRLGETQRIASKWKVDWLESVDWDRLLAMDAEPPYRPKVKGLTDTHKFASAFTEAPAALDSPEVEGRSPLGSLSSVFEGFDYVAPIRPPPAVPVCAPVLLSGRRKEWSLDGESSLRKPLCMVSTSQPMMPGLFQMGRRTIGGVGGGSGAGPDSPVGEGRAVAIRTSADVALPASRLQLSKSFQESVRLSSIRSARAESSTGSEPSCNSDSASDALEDLRRRRFDSFEAEASGVVRMAAALQDQALLCKYRVRHSVPRRPLPPVAMATSSPRDSTAHDAHLDSPGNAGLRRDEDSAQRRKKVEASLSAEDMSPIGADDRFECDGGMPAGLQSSPLGGVRSSLSGLTRRLYSHNDLLAWISAHAHPSTS